MDSATTALLTLKILSMKCYDNYTKQSSTVYNEAIKKKLAYVFSSSQLLLANTVSRSLSRTTEDEISSRNLRARLR